jgi:hypothetical protein
MPNIIPVFAASEDIISSVSLNPERYLIPNPMEVPNMNIIPNHMQTWKNKFLILSLIIGRSGTGISRPAKMVYRIRIIPRYFQKLTLNKSIK